MDDTNRIEEQIAVEKRFNRKHIDGYIRDAIQASEEMQAKITHGVTLLQEYMNQDYYESKNARIKQLKHLDLVSLITDIFVGIAYCQREELFTSVTSLMSGRLKFNDRVQAITTVAEMLAVLCNTDAFDICKADRQASLTVISRIPLSENIIRFIENSQYLPPMVCKPLTLESNYSSGYLTHNDSLILGRGNHHDGDICLDVLNLVNGVELRLDTEFLSTVEEQPTFDLDTPEKSELWQGFKRQSYEFYLLIAKADNRFHLTHKVDKRGRLYASGYHITTQGTAFKKASIELAYEEVVDGVPA